MTIDYTTVCYYCRPRRGLRRTRAVARVAAYTVAVKTSPDVRNCCPAHLTTATTDQMAAHGEPAVVVVDLQRIATEPAGGAS